MCLLLKLIVDAQKQDPAKVSATVPAPSESIPAGSTQEGSQQETSSIHASDFQQGQRRESSPIRKGRFSVVTHKPDEVEEITQGVIGLEELSSKANPLLQLQTSQPSMFHHLQNAAASAALSAPSLVAAAAHVEQLQAIISDNNGDGGGGVIDANANNAQDLIPQEYLQRRFSQCLAPIPGQSFHGPPVFVTAGPPIQVSRI